MTVLFWIFLDQICPKWVKLVLITMGADYSIELISIETYLPQFIGNNEIFVGSVSK